MGCSYKWQRMGERTCRCVSSPFNDAKVSDLLCVIHFALSDAFCSVL